MATTGTADEFIGGELWSMNLPVNVYSGPDTTKFVYAIPKNSFVGKIYAYVVRDGKVWWQIDNKNLNRFVKHETGIFDAAKLQASIDKLNAEKQAEIDEKVDERLSNKPGFFEAIENLLSDIFGDLGGIFKIAIPALLLIVLIFIIK